MTSHALDVIRARVDPEGYAVPKQELADMMERRVIDGLDHVFDCGALVFTVSKNPQYPVVHLFGAGPGRLMLAAGRRFMREVWAATGHVFLLAPVKNATVLKCCKRAGWRVVGIKPTGHVLIRIDRGEQ